MYASIKSLIYDQTLSEYGISAYASERISFFSTTDLPLSRSASTSYPLRTSSDHIKSLHFDNVAYISRNIWSVKKFVCFNTYAFTSATCLRVALCNLTMILRSARARAPSATSEYNITLASSISVSSLYPLFQGALPIRPTTLRVFSRDRRSRTVKLGSIFATPAANACSDNDRCKNSVGRSFLSCCASIRQT